MSTIKKWAKQDAEQFFNSMWQEEMAPFPAQK